MKDLSLLRAYESIACVASGFSRKLNTGSSLPPKGGSHTPEP